MSGEETMGAELANVILIRTTVGILSGTGQNLLEVTMGINVRG